MRGPRAAESAQAPRPLHGTFSRNCASGHGAIPGTPAAVAYGWRSCHTTFSDIRSPWAWSARFTRRHTWPATNPADDVDDAPAAISLLNVLQRKCRDLGAAQPATEQDRQHRSIAQSLLGGYV